MSANITFNPYVQSAGNSGLFNTQSTGFRQGTAYPDPSTRWRLRGGVLAASETIVMWGGVGVYADVPGGSGNPNYSLGPIVGRAVSLSDAAKPLAGFSVFDQAYGMVTSPQSPVPTIGTYGQVLWYPLGSLARIIVQADPVLADLRGGPIGAAVSWDFTNQLLVPEEGSLTITSGTFVSGTGVITLLMAAPITFDPGDSVTLASLTGSGAVASLDGTWTAIAPSTGTTLTLQGPVGVGAAAITGGTATVGGAASQLLPVKVLDFQTTNCEVVVHDPVTGFTTYNYNGAAAVIQL